MSARQSGALESPRAAEHAKVAVVSPRRTESKWGDVVTSLPLVRVSASNASMGSEQQQHLGASPRRLDAHHGAVPASPHAIVLVSNSSLPPDNSMPPQLSHSSQSSPANAEQSNGTKGNAEANGALRTSSSSFWDQHEQFALARARELREAQRELDIPSPLVARGSASRPNAATAPVNAAAPVRPHPAQGASRPDHSQVDSSVENVSAVRGEETILPRRARSSSLRKKSGNSMQADRSSSGLQAIKHASLDVSDPESELSKMYVSTLADSSCLSELVEVLQRRLSDQGRQIAQLRAELGSRTRVAAAFAGARSNHC